MQASDNPACPGRGRPAVSSGTHAGEHACHRGKRADYPVRYRLGSPKAGRQNAPERRLHARAARRKPTARATRAGGNTQSHRHRGGPRCHHRTRAGADFALWRPDATTSRWRPWPDPGFRMFRLVQHEWEETGMHLQYLWARRPAVAGGSVHHVQAVSSHVTSSPPSRRRAARSPAFTTRFTTVHGTQKALSLLEKGLDLRKLVAGAGFEPATSGL
jgi:hypothetical protein